MKPWQTLASTTLVEDRWIKLTADRCALPNGTTIEPYYVLHESDWVHVFAQRDDGSVLVVKQFRYGARVTCTELPGGVIDSGETPLAAAQRELLEETGHSADEWHSVGWMYANPARQTNAVHLFIATGLAAVGTQALDDSEEIDYEFASLDEIERMIEQNEFSQSMHVASVYRCLRWLERHPLSAPRPGE